MPNFTNKVSVQEMLGTNDADNTFTSSSVTANRSGSIFERLQDLIEQSDRNVVTGAALLVTGTTVFTVAGGPIIIQALLSLCMVGSDSTAATLQWSADGTVGAATTFTAASASRANQAAGDMIVCNFTALATAPDLVAAGVGLGPVLTKSGIIVPAGIITTTVGSGPTTTGTYKHYMRFRPLAPGVTVTAAF
jgi:hypothetical protein